MSSKCKYPSIKTTVISDCCSGDSCPSLICVEDDCDCLGERYFMPKCDANLDIDPLDDDGTNYIEIIDGKNQEDCLSIAPTVEDSVLSGAGYSKCAFVKDNCECRYFLSKVDDNTQHPLTEDEPKQVASQWHEVTLLEGLKATFLCAVPAPCDSVTDDTTEATSALTCVGGELVNRPLPEIPAPCDEVTSDSTEATHALDCVGGELVRREIGCNCTAYVPDKTSNGSVLFAEEISTADTIIRNGSVVLEVNGVYSVNSQNVVFQESTGDDYSMKMIQSHGVMVNGVLTTRGHFWSNDHDVVPPANTGDCVSVGHQYITVTNAPVTLTMESFTGSRGTAFASRTYTPEIPSSGNGAASYIDAHWIAAA